MLRKFKVNVDGRSYTVAVEELPAEDHPPQAATHAAPPPVMPPAAPVAPATASPAAPQMSAAAGDVVAPLAGVVDSIDVRVGQPVEAGDRVMVIEAMKMKTDVLTKVTGTVQRIAVKPHESVDTNQVLLTVG
jgi:biotin carboxyl carrier protein